MNRTAIFSISLMVALATGAVFTAPVEAQTNQPKPCAAVVPPRYTVELPSGIFIQIERFVWETGKDRMKLIPADYRIFCDTF